MTARLADELPFLIHSTGNREQLHECLSNLCVFRLMYTRGHCSELLDYWGAIGLDKQGMAVVYFDAVKKVEEGRYSNKTTSSIMNNTVIYFSPNLDFIRVL